MTPTEVLDECRAKAKAKVAEGNTLGWIGASVIVALWILALGFAFVLGRRLFFKFRSPTVWSHGILNESLLWLLRLSMTTSDKMLDSIFEAVCVPCSKKRPCDIVPLVLIAAR